jgi:hypothetical protein
MITTHPNDGVTIVDASDLRLRPGLWPLTITINGVTAYRDRANHDPDGAILDVFYVTASRHIYVVIND